MSVAHANTELFENYQFKQDVSKPDASQRQPKFELVWLQM